MRRFLLTAAAIALLTTAQAQIKPMETIFVWIFLAIIVGVVANSRGRSGVDWFFLRGIHWLLIG